VQDPVPGLIRRFCTFSVAALCLAVQPAISFAQGDAGANAKEDGHGNTAQREADSHHVQDALQTGAKKVGDALNTGARKVGPAIDHGVDVTKKAIGKSADAVGSALQETGKKIEEKVGTKK
jgi:hypothetical protein